MDIDTVYPWHQIHGRKFLSRHTHKERQKKLETGRDRVRDSDRHTRGMLMMANLHCQPD